MTAWLLDKMRALVAIVTIAVYAFCATPVPASASTSDCFSHPCHGVVQSDADGASGQHFHDGAGPTGGMAKADLGGGGKAKSHADPGCPFSCSTGLSPAPSVLIPRTPEVAVGVRALVRDPDGRSPERLVRPPRSPFV